MSAWRREIIEGLMCHLRLLILGLRASTRRHHPRRSQAALALDEAYLYQDPGITHPAWD